MQMLTDTDPWDSPSEVFCNVEWFLGESLRKCWLPSAYHDQNDVTKPMIFLRYKWCLSLRSRLLSGKPPMKVLMDLRALYDFMNTRFDKKSNNNLAHLLDSLDSLRLNKWNKCWTQAAHFWGRYDNSYLIPGNRRRKRSRKVVKVMKPFLLLHCWMDRLGTTRSFWLWWLGATWTLWSWKWKLGCKHGHLVGEPSYEANAKANANYMGYSSIGRGSI